MAEEQVDRLLADGQLALQEERFDDARLAYNKVLSSSPDNATAHHGLAMAADLSEQWADAEYHYRQALRIRPRDANLLCDIGYSYLLQNRYAEAARYLNHAIEVNPQHESAQMNLALLDLRQGNRQAAENRVISKFGSGAQAMQIMAQLESQTTAVTAAFKTDASTSIPSNATFEQVQELARQERLEAERRRASHGLSQESAGQPGTQMNKQPMTPQVNSRPSIESDVQIVSNRNGLPFASAHDASTGLPLSIPGARHAELAARSGGQPQNSEAFNAGFGNGPVPDPRQAAAGSPLNGGLTSGGKPHDSGNPQGLPHSGIDDQGNNSVRSMPGVSMSNVTLSPDVPSGGIPSMHPSFQPPRANGHPGLANTTSQAALSGTTDSNSVAAPQPYGLNSLPAKVVPIHSSGVFQGPQNGSLSYGQPLGFNAPTVKASHQPPVPSLSGYAVPSNAESSPSVYLEGLNAGPGSIFPVSGSTPQAGPSAQSLSAANGPPGLNMNTVSSPGTNSLVNGAMYEQPASALPSQDWGNEQQQLLRAQQLQSQQWQAKQSMGRWPTAAPPQNSASWGAGSYGANPGSWPGTRPAAVNSLEAYEKQRQQLDSEYHRKLQQLDRQNPAAMPQF